MRLTGGSKSGSRSAVLLPAVNLALMVLVFFQLHPPEEVSCGEGIQHSIFDRFIAGGYFFFYYSSEVARAWVYLNLPALLWSHLLESIFEPLTDSTVSGYHLSWVRAGFVVMSTSAQWALVGYGHTKLRRMGSYE